MRPPSSCSTFPNPARTDPLSLSLSFSSLPNTGAGQPGVFSPTCGTGLCSDYVKDPRNFDEAYFEIQSIRIFDGGLNTRATNAVSAASGIIGAIGGQASGVSGAAGRGASRGGVGAALGSAVVAAAGLAGLALLQRPL